MTRETPPTQLLSAKTVEAWRSRRTHDRPDFDPPFTAKNATHTEFAEHRGNRLSLSVAGRVPAHMVRAGGDPFNKKMHAAEIRIAELEDEAKKLRAENTKLRKQLEAADCAHEAERGGRSV
jgi:hypothetical protein